MTGSVLGCPSFDRWDHCQAEEGNLNVAVGEAAAVAADDLEAGKGMDSPGVGSPEAVVHSCIEAVVRASETDREVGHVRHTTSRATDRRCDTVRHWGDHRHLELADVHHLHHK